LGGGAAVIAFRDVHKSFGPKKVLEGFSLEIPDGETTVVIGYSGTGKSVALKHAVGLLEPDSGAVEVDGRIVHELDRKELMVFRSTVGFVFQFAALFDSMTVKENITLGLKRQDVPVREMDERVIDSLAMVDMEGTEDRYPIELSGGMRKRVGIARAIALRPRYILYDEPTSGLDPVTSAVINQLMVRAREKLGVTGLVVTHDMRSAFSVGDRIAMLYNGVVRQVGTAEQISKTHDPILRQFIEGRPEAADDADRARTQVL
jgi:phospholipid/cholesterol/gamma-HCH transport system ATP-binding protein